MFPPVFFLQNRKGNTENIVKHLHLLSALRDFFFLHRVMFSEAVARRCSVKKVLLKFLRNSQEKNCTRASFLLKLQAEASNLIKKTGKGVFLCEFCKKKTVPVTDIDIT